MRRSTATTTEEATEAIDETPVAQEEGTVEVHVLNPVTDRYEVQAVSESKGRTIVAGMMTEGWERDQRDRMNTETYDGRMHRLWVNADRSDPATVHAAELGYRPVMDREAARRHGHQVGKQNGWEGEVVHSGDAVLLEAPAAMVQAREAKREDIRRKQKEDNLSAAKNHMDAVLESQVGDENSYVMDSYRGQKFGYKKDVSGLSPEMLVSEQNNRAMLGAQALADAQGRLAEENGRGRVSFQGFRSSTGMDGAVPESPFFRSLIEKQLGK